MQQLHASDFSKLEKFFAQIPANAPMLRAFFEGRVPGHAFVDTLPAPTAAVVAVNYRFVFFGGAPTPAFQQTAIRQLRYQHAIDVVWPDAPAKLPGGAASAEVVSRVEFRCRRDRGEKHLEQLAAGAPGAEVKRIDSHNIGRCLWRDDVLRATGSTSEFLGHGLGFCLTVDGAMVAEAYAVIWSGSRAEIAAVTHPEHRKRGYATVLCASLIQACEAVDLQTYWNCEAENVGSMRLAACLGYDEPHLYRLLRYAHEAPVAKFGQRKKPRTIRGIARQLFGRTRAKE